MSHAAQQGDEPDAQISRSFINNGSCAPVIAGVLRYQVMSEDE
jgi:hypothetical protein